MSTELENGLVVPKKIQSASPNVFANGKTLLGQVGTPTKTGSSKTLSAGLDPAFPAGSTLAVIVDGACLRSNHDAIVANSSNAIISRAALGGLIDDLDSQAFTWTLPADMTASQISTQAESEACVTGVSFNKTYAPSAAIVNDPLHAAQVYATVDNADAANSIVFAPGTGLQRTGSAVVVATIDTGADVNHPDLAGHFWTGPHGHGFNLATGNYDPSDVSDEGHGTHVAGMIAAVSNNGIGISGMMPFRALIMPINIFSVDSSGNASSSTTLVYNAVRLAVANGASVINMSLQQTQTGAQTDAVMQQVLNDAVTAGTTVVVVIGNAATSNGQGTLIDNLNWSVVPGMYSVLNGVIGVGAIDTNGGTKSTFSNYSTTYAEIGAPGAVTGTSGLLSTIPTALGSYGYLAGTSQAAPQVAAAAAMTIAIIQNAYGVKPSAAEVERLIETSATKQAALAPYFKNGNQLNLVALVAYIKSQYPLALTGRTVPGC
jgi:subtilisin family serine protease